MTIEIATLAYLLFNIPISCISSLQNFNQFKITVEGKRRQQPMLYEAGVTIEYAQQKIELAGKLADESGENGRRFVSMLSLKHPSRWAFLTYFRVISILLES